MSENASIVIYSSITSNRLVYVLETVFRDRMDIPFTLIHDISQINGNDFVIEYNPEKTTNHLYIRSDIFITEKNINKGFKPVVSGTGEERVIFGHQDERSVLSFDIFSAVFYCLSHYDIYAGDSRDQHKRPVFSNYFIRTAALDQLPYVEIWIDWLRTILKNHGFTPSGSGFKTLISFDIDHFFLLGHRSFTGYVKGFLGDVIKLRLSLFIRRLLVLAGFSRDPAEHFFNLLDDTKDAVKPVFFLLMKSGKMNSLNPLSDAKVKAIRKLEQYGTLGIHPSYHSGRKAAMIDKETVQLRSITGKEITMSRFHYLRYTLPESYQYLAASGIKEDHSMGYYDQPGLMAATSLPYTFYDLSNDRSLPVVIRPFCWMDSMNRYYRTLDNREEKEELLYWKQVIQKYKGHFSVVFHNDSMTTIRYRVLYKSLL